NVSVTTAGGSSSAVTFTITTSAGQLTLTVPLSVTPSSPTTGQSTTAAFSVKNTGGQPISVQYFFAAARNPSNANVDFPVSSPQTLQPGQSYMYQGSRSFSTAGNYTAWPGYYTG